MQAVFWRLDNALRLYPLPAALVVADAAAAAEFGHPEVSCVNPVSHSYALDCQVQPVGYLGKQHGRTYLVYCRDRWQAGHLLHTGFRHKKLSCARCQTSDKRCDAITACSCI